MKRFIRLLAVVSLVIMVGLLGGFLARTSLVRADTPPDTSGQDQGTPLPSGVTPDQPQEQASQQVFFYKDGQLAGVDRQVTGGAQVAGFTVSELLKGPTDDEKAQGYSTQIPDGVKMLYYTESNDGKTFGVDLSAELEGVQGDPGRARQALDQVIKTAQAVSGAETINITINGEDAWQTLGISRSAMAAGGSNLWWIILVVVLGTLTLSGTSLMLLAMRRDASSERPIKPIQSTARKSIKVSRPTEKKKRIRFSRKAGKQ